MTTASVDSEISQLEHELEILRSRRALMERGGRALRFFFMAVAIVIAGLVIYVLFMDVVVGLFIAGMSAAVAVLAWSRPQHRKARSGRPAPAALDRQSIPPEL
jgi:Flp pilus assembly protein TadB